MWVWSDKWVKNEVSHMSYSYMYELKETEKNENNQ